MVVLKIGINASRARSGGAISHLCGILNEFDWHANNDIQIHVWSYKSILSQLPHNNQLFKHSHTFLEKSIFYQLYWERFILPKQLQRIRCNILLNVDAGTVCRYEKMVTMSRDMLSYEPGEMHRFPLSKEKLRLILLKYIQNASLRASNGTIFLTHYAGKLIQESCGKLKNVHYIPHGVGKDFYKAAKSENEENILQKPVHVLYVSNIAPYKHQWNVVKAISLLRYKGYDVRLTLTGGGHIDALTGSQKKLDVALNECDPEGKFVTILGYVSQTELPNLLNTADIFVFASSCENMPNTLIEAMSVGLPIACSNRGPMPEVLQNAGVYFNPESAISIATAIELYLKDKSLMIINASKANQLARHYSWARCARETFAFLREVYNYK
jgi:glycosyltransferase involved in cell wall biosynthesis